MKMEILVTFLLNMLMEIKMYLFYKQEYKNKIKTFLVIII